MYVNDYLLITNVTVSKLWKQTSYLVTLVSTEQTRVVPFLHNNERYSRLISDLQFHASLTDGSQFMSKDNGKLSFADAVTVVNDACRLEVCCSVELHQKVTNHRRQLLNHLLTMRLQANCR